MRSAKSLDSDTVDSSHIILGDTPNRKPLEIPAGLSGSELGSDDAGALPRPLSAGALPAIYNLPDGYSIGWERPTTLTVNAAYLLHFVLRDPDGRPARDTVPYMGMVGHAAFVKTDGSVFAHTHPDGSAAMPALALANGDSASGSGKMHSMPGMDASAPSAKIAPTVDFSYGFPKPGPYLIHHPDETRPHH